jgi:hypothetical protein
VRQEPALLDEFGHVEGLRVLDLGCGDAALGRVLRGAGCASYLGMRAQQAPATAGPPNAATDALACNRALPATVASGPTTVRQAGGSGRALEEHRADPDHGRQGHVRTTLYRPTMSEHRPVDADPSASPSEGTGAAQGPELTEVERQILALEAQRFHASGAKEAAIRDRLGLAPIRYYQILNRLLDRPQALAEAPQLVHRLRRIRDDRSRARSGPTSGPSRRHET